MLPNVSVTEKRVISFGVPCVPTIGVGGRTVADVVGTAATTGAAADTPAAADDLARVARDLQESLAMFRY